jgi:hypothetical protein
MTQYRPITAKQLIILKLLYQHRFLNRTQIQSLLHHKEKKRTSAWLKDLRTRDFIAWIYHPDDFALKTQPAIYYLSLEGIRYLRSLDYYPAAELRKRYKESQRKPDFIERCMLVAGVCLNLEVPDESVSYSYATEADYMNDQSPYHSLIEIHPQLCFIKTAMSAKGRKITTNYLLEVFAASTPRYALRRRLQDYINYLEDSDWEADFVSKPIVLLACPTTADLIYGKRRVRSVLENIGRTEDTFIRFATVETLRREGVRGFIWEEA